MDAIGRRIAIARREAGLSAEQLADRIGKSVHTVRSYELGRTKASVDVLRAIEGATGRSVEWLLNGDAGSQSDLTDILQRTERQLEEIRKRLADRAPAEVNEVPIHRWVRVPIVGIAPGGAWEEAVTLEGQQFPLAIIDLPPDLDYERCCFAIVVNGDSMAGAGIQSGTTVVVCRELEIVHNCIVLARWGNGVTIKRYMETVDGPCLVPDNPAYKPVRVADDVEIIGRVIYSGQTHM